MDEPSYLNSLVVLILIISSFCLSNNLYETLIFYSLGVFLRAPSKSVLLAREWDYV